MGEYGAGGGKWGVGDGESYYLDLTNNIWTAYVKLLAITDGPGLLLLGHSCYNGANKSFINVAIMKTRLFKYIENFTLKNKKNFQIKNSDIFHISSKNIDCGYSLEPLRRGGSNGYPQSMILNRNVKNNVYPCKPQF